eukprot:8774261-Pyramimonas_sp.AAC.1
MAGVREDSDAPEVAAMAERGGGVLQQARERNLRPHRGRGHVAAVAARRQRPAVVIVAIMCCKHTLEQRAKCCRGCLCSSESQEYKG